MLILFMEGIKGFTIIAFFFSLPCSIMKISSLTSVNLIQIQLVFDKCTESKAKNRQVTFPGIQCGKDML